MYHVQKCNENSLLFFSLTLNNRNRWDCLGMLEFVCCLPKLGMILCYFSSLCLNKPASLWKTKCNRLPSPLPTVHHAHVFVFVLFETSHQKSASQGSHMHSCSDVQSKSKFSEIGRKAEPKYVRNVSSMCVET